MKRFNLVLILLLIIFQGCVENECGECFTPPQSFVFEIVDKTSGENLFTNGTLDANEITIIDLLNNNESIEFSFLNENDTNLILINSIGWKTEIVNLKIDISGNHIYNLYVDAERKLEDCCSFTTFNQISITNSEFELDNQTGVYKILVE